MDRPRVVLLGALALGLMTPLGAGCSSTSQGGKDAGGEAGVDVPPADAGSHSLPPGCDPPPFTYADFGMAFVNRYCFSCHEFNQSDVQQLSSVIYDVAVSSGDSSAMPPGDPRPTLAERMNLGAWLNCGAP
jgi:hypothetical protein